MVIVKVHYGLGNQLFQYSLARSLSLRKGWDFRLDTSFFITDKYEQHPRVYQLDQFNIIEQLATPAEAERFTKPSFLERRRRSLANRLLPYYKQKVVKEVRLDYDENILNVNDDSYLFGYWQDLRYFSPVEEVLRKELSFRYPPAGRDKDMLEKIRSTNAVSLHIRRGDYLSDQYTVNNVGTCDPGYYEDAVRQLARDAPDPVFYIFSDDPPWVKQHFHIPYPTVYVDHNPEEKAFEDLRLLSSCRHHIIANSSFSWWGAWLSSREGKKVIAPRIWRKNGPGMQLPAGWLTV